MLVHARSRAPAWSALIAARRAKVPFVTTYHGALLQRNNAVKRAYNSVMARGDVTIANSAFTADLITERYGLRREKIVVIHRGLDPDRFDPAAVSRSGWMRCAASGALPGPADHPASGSPHILEGAGVLIAAARS